MHSSPRNTVPSSRSSKYIFIWRPPRRAQPIGMSRIPGFCGAPIVGNRVASSGLARITSSRPEAEPSAHDLAESALAIGQSRWARVGQLRKGVRGCRSHPVFSISSLVRLHAGFRTRPLQQRSTVGLCQSEKTLIRRCLDSVGFRQHRKGVHPGREALGPKVAWRSSTRCGPKRTEY
jgi:hypothetical protein